MTQEPEIGRQLPPRKYPTLIGQREQLSTPPLAPKGQNFGGMLDRVRQLSQQFRNNGPTSASSPYQQSAPMPGNPQMAMLQNLYRQFPWLAMVGMGAMGTGAGAPGLGMAPGAPSLPFLGPPGMSPFLGQAPAMMGR